MTYLLSAIFGFCAGRLMCRHFIDADYDMMLCVAVMFVIHFWMRLK